MITMINLALNLPKFPTTAEELGIYLAVVLATFLGWFVRNIVAAQKEINTTLANHFRHDQATMETQNEALRDIAVEIGRQSEISRVLLDEMREVRKKR